MRCDEVAELLSPTPSGHVVDDPVAAAHVESCLRCQAELVQYRRLARSLRGLKDDVLDPGPGLVVDILAAIEEVGERHAARGVLQGRTVAYVGGFAVATAAAGAGALVLAARGGRKRMRIAG